MRKLTSILSTDGCGYWSDVAKDVKIVGYNLAYVNDECDFGELRVYFDTKTWDVNTHGLIYTDRRFERNIRNLFERLNMDGADISYSEQGMQGDNYVSFDVGAKFIESFNAMTQLESML
jgi:hypothetical protein